MSVKILAFAGSLRVDSYNKKLVKIAADGARSAGGEVTFCDLRDLPMPMFDEDLESRDGLHPNARKFKDLLLAHQGFLIACPEYNSSISAVLKNAIDWASRPVEGEKPLECFNDKVVVLISTSPGKYGGLRGLVTVRSILGNINCIVLPNQIAVPFADEAFDSTGRLKDAKLHKSIEGLGAVIVRTVGKLAT